MLIQQAFSQLNLERNKYPFKKIGLVSMEILDFISHSNHNVTIYIKENTVVYSNNRIECNTSLKYLKHIFKNNLSSLIYLISNRGEEIFLCFWMYSFDKEFRLSEIASIAWSDFMPICLSPIFFTRFAFILEKYSSKGANSGKKC